MAMGVRLEFENFDIIRVETGIYVILICMKGLSAYRFKEHRHGPYRTTRSAAKCTVGPDHSGRRVSPRQPVGLSSKVRKIVLSLQPAGQSRTPWVAADAERQPAKDHQALHSKPGRRCDACTGAGVSSVSGPAEALYGDQ